MTVVLHTVVPSSMEVIAEMQQEYCVKGWRPTIANVRMLAARVLLECDVLEPEQVILYHKIVPYISEVRGGDQEMFRVVGL